MERWVGNVHSIYIKFSQMSEVKMNFQEHQQDRLTPMPSSWEKLNTMQRYAVLFLRKWHKVEH